MYAALQPNFVGPRVIGDRRRLSCAVRDCRSERISVTRENDCDTRASRDAMLPVVGTMLSSRTNTGALPSDVNGNPLNAPLWSAATQLDAQAAERLVHRVLCLAEHQLYVVVRHPVRS